LDNGREFSAVPFTLLVASADSSGGKDNSGSSGSNDSIVIFKVDNENPYG
jgi:hypothetical protein